MEKVNCIILIDDDPVTNFLNAEVIKSLDIAKDVKAFTAIGEALALVKEKCGGSDCPEIIFLDVNMATEDGFDFLNELHFLNADFNKMKVIMLSSSNLSKDKNKAKQLGAFDYLVKPLDEVSLMSVVRSAQLKYY